MENKYSSMEDVFTGYVNQESKNRPLLGWRWGSNREKNGREQMNWLGEMGKTVYLIKEEEGRQIQRAEVVKQQ